MADESRIYINGGEGPPSEDDEDYEDDVKDMVGRNPTGRRRKSSARARRKADRKLFGGTLWGK